MNRIDKITELIADYNHTDITALNMNYLMTLRKDLSTLAFFFGKDVANLKRDLEQCKAQRKIDFYRIQEKHLDEGLGKSVVFAEKGLAGIRKEEGRLEGNFAGSKIILTQVNEVLSSINQDISQLKAEYKADI
jgi:hypothetical protein